MSSIATDQKYLGNQYKTDDNLATRIRTHQLYSYPKDDWATWVLDHIDWTGAETVIDVGCGSGAYVDETRTRAGSYIACDLSHGMLKSLPQSHLNSTNLDAHQLPFEDNCADYLLANHMIYHLGEPNKALQEFVRVLKPGGKLVAATNSAFSMSEFKQLSVSAAQGLGLLDQLRGVEPELYDEGSPNLISQGFSLENGRAMLEPHFAHVELFLSDSAFVFPEPQPVIDYLATNRERREKGMQQFGRTWPDLAQEMQKILTAHIAEHGEFRVNKQTCLFIASN